MWSALSVSVLSHNTRNYEIKLKDITWVFHRDFRNNRAFRKGLLITTLVLAPQLEINSPCRWKGDCVKQVIIIVSCSFYEREEEKEERTDDVTRIGTAYQRRKRVSHGSSHDPRLNDHGELSLWLYPNVNHHEGKRKEFGKRRKVPRGWPWIIY